jgi:tetratricopeptide (TPR) repeat protein
MYLTHSRKLSMVLISIGILVVIIIFSWNHMTAFYFQTRGGSLIDDILNSDNSQQFLSISCLRKDLDSFDQKSKLTSASAFLIDASLYNPSSAQTVLLLGRAYCMLGKYEHAVETFQKYTGMRPNNPLGHLELGFAYEAFGTQDAIYQNNLFGKLDTIQPEQIREYWKLYRSEDAVNEWLTAGITSNVFSNLGNKFDRDKNFTEAFKWYRRALWLEIDSAATWIAVAKNLNETGYPQRALKAYEAAYYFDPETGAIDFVNALDSQKDSSQIESILNEVLENYPESDQRFQWWEILLSTFTRQERWSEVERISRRALDENPMWLGFHINLGWALYHQNADWQAAINEFEQAIEIDKSRPEGYFAIAQLFTREERFTDADTYYVKAIEITPNDRWYQLSRATNARNARNITLALGIFEDILDNYPEYGQAYYEAALTYYIDEQFDKAKEAIERAISLLDMPDQWYYARAGVIFEGAGDLDRALDYYRLALEVNPANITALEGLARLGN